VDAFPPTSAVYLFSVISFDAVDLAFLPGGRLRKTSRKRGILRCTHRIGQPRQAASAAASTELAAGVV
jgi:hypothetical protein